MCSAGNAKLAGLVTQLELTGNRYNIALVSRPIALFIDRLIPCSKTMFFIVGAETKLLRTCLDSPLYSRTVSSSVPQSENSRIYRY